MVTSRAMTYTTPTQPGGPTAPPGPPPPPAPPSGFFGRLFDVRFRGFVTPMVVPVLYVLGMIGIGIAYLIYVVGAFSVNASFGVLVLLIIGPIMAMIGLLFLRLTLEFYVALTRLSEDFREWRAEWHRRQTSS